MAISVKELRRRGESEEDIRNALRFQETQRRCGVPVHSLGRIFSGKKPPASEPADLTQRQLRTRGRIGQAALLLDQEALADPDFIRKTQLRSLAFSAKELANIPAPLEYDFFKGNWSVSDEYHDTIRDRIHALPMSTARRAMAVTVMAEIVRWLPWQDAACSKTAAEIANLLRMQVADVSRAIKTLEEVGAIHRVARGRTKLIYVNPEGAYRGKIDNHAQTVDAFKKTMAKAGNVIPIRGEP